MHRLFFCIPVLVLLTACAVQAPDCRAMQHRTDWIRITAAPPFVDHAFLADLYLSGRVPEASDIAWYTNQSGQFIACEPGDSRGCGDVTVLIEAGGQRPAERIEEITVCGHGNAS